jgi:hypothetical protein
MRTLQIHIHGLFARCVPADLGLVLHTALGIALLLMTPIAKANDGIGELGVGGVIAYGRTDKVTMRKEVLEIGTDRIGVAYEFVNESDAPVTLPIVFPLPPYGAGTPSPDYSGQPSGFSLTIDSKARPFTTSVHAVVRDQKGGEGKDVTHLLTAAGLTQEQIALFPGAFRNSEVDISPFRSPNAKKVQAVSSEQLKELRALGLLELNPNTNQDFFDFPRWSVHIAYHWIVTFPPKKVVSISHSYEPFLGLGSTQFLSPSNTKHEKKLRDLFCSSPSLIKQLKSATPNDESIPGATISYILTTANTWNGPIRDFTLRIRKSKPDEVISLCFPGQFTKTNSSTFESHLKDFSPTDELLIKYLLPGVQDIFPYEGKHGNSTVPVVNRALKP